MTTKLNQLLCLLLLVLTPLMTGCAVDASDEEIGNLSEEIRLPGRFTVFEASNGEFYFNLKAGNGEIILQSEGYKTKAGANGGVEAVKTYGVDMSFYAQHKASNGQYYFTLLASNHEVIGVSELYTRKYSAKRGALTVRRVVAKILRLEAALSGGAAFDLFEGQDGQYYFNLEAANHEVVLSSEGYVQKSSALAGIDSVRAHGRDLNNFEILEAKNGQYYFNLKAANHKIIGTSELYVSKGNAKRGAETVAALLYSERVADPQ
jgi:hypothetical protein